MKQFRKLCQGQVRVRVQGDQIGRFLTVLIARGILYENAAYEGAEFFLTLAARHYRKASVCAKKTNVRLRIVSKKGWPFFCFRHRRRKWTVLFVLPMMLAIIWVVKTFFVQFFCVFLPPLLNIFCFCQVHTISVLY